MADPHGFSLVFLNVLNWVMALMAVLLRSSVRTYPVRLTVVISILLFHFGSFEGVVNQQDHKVEESKWILGKLAGPQKKPSCKWLLFRGFGSKNLNWKLLFFQFLCLRLFFFIWFIYSMFLHEDVFAPPKNSRFATHQAVGGAIRWYCWGISGGGSVLWRWSLGLRYSEIDWLSCTNR